MGSSSQSHSGQNPLAYQRSRIRERHHPPSWHSRLARAIRKPVADASADASPSSGAVVSGVVTETLAGARNRTRSCAARDVRRRRLDGASCLVYAFPGWMSPVS
jgi:hypothetical protein